MLDADLNYNLKYANQIKAPSVKLFRIDGDIPVQSWITLTGQFFSHNPLIIEYFEKDYPPHIKELIAKLEVSKYQNSRFYKILLRISIVLIKQMSALELSIPSFSSLPG